MTFRIELDEYESTEMVDLDFWVGTHRVGFVRLRENHQVTPFDTEEIRRAVDAYLRVS